MFDGDLGSGATLHTFLMVMWRAVPDVVRPQCAVFEVSRARWIPAAGEAWFHPVRRSVVLQRHGIVGSRMAATFLVWCRDCCLLSIGPLSVQGYGGRFRRLLKSGWHIGGCCVQLLFRFQFYCLLELSFIVALMSQSKRPACLSSPRVEVPIQSKEFILSFFLFS